PSVSGDSARAPARERRRRVSRSGVPWSHVPCTPRSLGSPSFRRERAVHGDPGAGHGEARGDRAGRWLLGAWRLDRRFVADRAGHTATAGGAASRRAEPERAAGAQGGERGRGALLGLGDRAGGRARERRGRTAVRGPRREAAVDPRRRFAPARERPRLRALRVPTRSLPTDRLRAAA